MLPDHNYTRLPGGQVIPARPEARPELQQLGHPDAEEVHALAEGLAGDPIAFGNNHQSSNSSAAGVSSEDLATLVSMIRFSIPILGLPEEQQAAVEGDVAALEAEAATGNPDQGRVRTFLQRVGSVVQSVATNPMAQNMVLTGVGTATGPAGIATAPVEPPLREQRPTATPSIPCRSKVQ
ncbi:hypothetical protein [Kitasatospora sp. NPDC050463]|uniref:hypothetical protein n=1 Tax=Kitasatospora sp. NPDC050463 TaxID=3155786 RepID=UPI0033D9F483